MNKEDLGHLEKLMNFLAGTFLKKKSWKDVSKSEWTYIVEELNGLLQERNRKQRIKKESDLFGANYLYEHLIINKLKAYENKKDFSALSKPNLGKLSRIVQVLGYDSYIDFINSHNEVFSFTDLKIDIPKATINHKLLDELVGLWYSYNRNLPDNPERINEERIWRSSVEIYKSESTGEYFIERSGGDNHKYYGKVTSYADYIFIIMNSNTFIRQRHFISRLKDIGEKLKQPNYRIEEVHFISTCISFNQEPIALFEIFQKVNTTKNYVADSVSFPIESNELPAGVVAYLRDTEGNRINYR
ncbi:hypothetical protein SAMN04487898_11855 [Pedobacter sp. ok626]|uniref:hypothetical protein n=1 Tax=Pedobacter sp. ok626 TaxID=1761882 RepID=UPI0008805561|nr:hypothetical protein [Pedobacter sp. ok626]SDL40100.1 hypothetical protein SAMN04487898_11855 [Pedobacter sp. ok626]